MLPPKSNSDARGALCKSVPLLLVAPVLWVPIRRGCGSASRRDLRYTGTSPFRGVRAQPRDPLPQATLWVLLLLLLLESRATLPRACWSELPASDWGARVGIQCVAIKFIYQTIVGSLTLNPKP